MKSNSVYIHIPFCKKICSYCDFCKVYYNETWAINYLDKLEIEIKNVYQDEIIKTIYIGGGTPSALSFDALKKLFDIIKIFKLDKECEFTFECNLSDINEKLLEVLVSGGVNRLSIGVQSFNKNNLLYLNRKASFLDAKEKINLCKKMGIGNVNVDLIYALKGQSLFDLDKDLDLFLKLDITHISTYSLILEKNTILSYQNESYVDEDIDAMMYKHICDKLKENGFIHYEVSNFAKDVFFSKHNLTYWNNETYYGFGLGASGYLENVRYTNTRSLSKYLKEEFLDYKELITEEDRFSYELMLGFRKLEGINVENINKKFKINLLDMDNIQKELNNNNLVYENGNIFINPDKLYIMNEILVNLL